MRAQSRKSLGQWALKRAEYRELAAIFDISDELMALDDLTLVVSTAIDPESEPYQRVFWENEIDKGEPTREFVSGFVEGAMEVLEAVDAKISAVSWAALS